MPRTLIAVVAAGLLAAACTASEPDPGPSLPPSPIDASDGESGGAPGETNSLPDLRDSAELSEPVVARGVVTHADGSPAADVPVTLVIRPDPSDAATPTPVAEARTQDDGSYELRIAAEHRAGLTADPDGVIEYEIGVGTDGTTTYAWSGPPELTHPQTADLELAEAPR